MGSSLFVCTTVSAVSFALLLAQPASAEPVKARFVEAELVTEVHAIKAGEPFWAGLRLAMDPDWHTYWMNPGDSGLPTSIDWDLPEGFSAGAIKWPYPQRFEHPPYISYGYEDEVLLIAEITPPAGLPDGASLSLSARADWTVCREDLCMPGGADLTLDVSTTDEEPTLDRYWKAYFEKTRARLPHAIEDWQVVASADDKTLRLTLTPGAARDPGTIMILETSKDTLDHDKPVSMSRDGDAIALEVALDERGGGAPEQFSAVLLASRHWDDSGRVKALQVSVPVTRR